MLSDQSIKTDIREVSDVVFGRQLSQTLLFRLPEAVRMRRAHFEEDLTLEQRRTLFAKSVNFIEIETHSYCNRVCWFCPNSVIDRRTTRHYLPEAAFLRILADLRSIDYRRRFYFSHYNEPFGDSIIFERLAQTRQALPRAHLRIHSNGDFLCSKTIDRAIRLGMNELQIGAYLPNEVAWTPDVAERRLRKITDRLELRRRQRRETPGERITYECGRKRVRIVVFCPNYTQEGICRGGVVGGVPTTTGARMSPCLYAVTDLYVEYNGHVMPCCNLRSDVEAHRPFSLGQIDETPGSIFTVWGSPAAARWRRSMAVYGPKAGPCRTCKAREWPETRLAKALYGVATRNVRPRPDADCLTPVSLDLPEA